MRRLLYRLLLVITIMVAVPATMTAQSSDAAYNKGVSMMNSGNYDGAISQFSVAKRLNSSASNISRCNAKIAECNRLKSEANKPKPDKNNNKDNRRTNTGGSNYGSGYGGSSGKVHYDPDYKHAGLYVELGTERLTFSGVSTESKNVVVNANSDKWKCSAEGPKGEAITWCHAEKTTIDGHNYVKITCDHSDNTLPRNAKVVINNEGQKYYIDILQSAGTRTDFTIDSYMIKNSVNVISRGEEKNAVIQVSKEKGVEQIVVTLNCTSDTTYANGKNWTVMECPDWVVIKEKKKIYEKMSAGKVFRSIRNTLDGEKSGDILVTPEKDELVFEVKPVRKAKEIQSGRIDDIVLRSQDQICTIKISQTKK